MKRTFIKRLVRTGSNPVAGTVRKIAPVVQETERHSPKVDAAGANPAGSTNIDLVTM